MKNKFLTACGLLLGSLPAFSQAPDYTPASEPETKKNQLGVVASPQLSKLFTNNQSLPVGLIFKRQIRPDKALRVSITGRFQKHINPQSLPYDSTTYSIASTNYYFNTLIGYEWQKQLSDRWTLYFGGDAGVGYGNYKLDIDFTDTDASANYPVIAFQNGNSWSFNLEPLAGIRFRIHPRLYAGVETKIKFSYNRYNDNLLSVNGNFPERKPVKLRTNTWQNYDLRYSPISNIQLVYQF